MKKLLIQLSKFFGTIAGYVENFFINLFGVIRSPFILIGRTKKPQVFYGYAHFYFAKKYAQKRYFFFKGDDKLGRRQCVFPYQEDRLVVFSPLDVKYLQKRGLISRERNYTKYVKQSYYKTKL